MKLGGWLAAALLLAAAPQSRAAEVLAPPQWSSDQVRAARPLAAEDVLVFDLKSETTGGKLPP